MGDPARELARQAEVFYLRAMMALSERAQLPVAIERLHERLREAEAAVGAVAEVGGRMARLAGALRLDDATVRFFWAAAALSGDPRLAVHAEALGGATARRGLSVAVFAEITGLDPEIARGLTISLASASPLVADGLLVPGVEVATPAACPYLVPAR